jgi:hypothetical protein
MFECPAVDFRLEPRFRPPCADVVDETCRLKGSHHELGVDRVGNVERNLAGIDKGFHHFVGRIVGRLVNG